MPLNILTIDANSFLGGMSLSDYYPNAGFSPRSIGFETDRGSQMGLLLPGRDATDFTTAGGVPILGTIITSVIDPLNGCYYAVTSLGNLYKISLLPVSNTLLTTGVTPPDHCFIFQGVLFITNSTDISYYDLTSHTLTNNWWTVTEAQTSLSLNSPHKFFEFRGVLYVIDGNKVHSWDGTTPTNSVFSLPPGWVITDVILDGATIYFSASYLIANNNSIYNPRTKIYGWNGAQTSPSQWQQEVEVYTGVVSSMVKVDVVGKNRSVFVLFTWTGMYILSEYFSMFTCTWMRSLSIAPNYNQVAINQGHIYFLYLDGVAKYNTHFNTLTVPFAYTGSIQSLNMGYLDYIDIFPSAGGSSLFLRGSSNNSLNNIGRTFYSNWTDLQNSKIRKIVIAFNGALPTSSTYTLNIYNEASEIVYTRVISNSTDGSVNTLNITNVAHNLPINLMQLTLQFNNSANVGVRFIKVYYEPSEMYVTQ